MKKTYVLDTNILVHSPDCLFGFEDNDLVITTMTVSELDKLKSMPGETGYGAREAIRQLRELNDRGELYRNGAELKTGGRVKIVMDEEKSCIADIFKLNEPDNRILNTVKSMQVRQENVYLVTNDNGMLLKAGACGIKAQDYHNESLDQNTKAYTGIKVVDCMLFDIKNVSFGNPLDIWDKTGLYENSFVILNALDANMKYPAKIKNGKIHRLEYVKDGKAVFGAMPRGIKQWFALEALLAPASEIPLVFLTGPAGTSKTFLSLAAGMEGVLKTARYDYMILTRNNVSFDEDIGFLPGREEEKISPLLRCFTDNLEDLIKLESPKISRADMSERFRTYFETGQICMEAMNFMRGRSLHDVYIIVDEAQNASVRQIKGMVTRPGIRTKTVLCGDPEQIDNAKLSRRSNGLVYAAEKMKDSALSAQVSFSVEDCIRSPLAKEAAKKL